MSEDERIEEVILYLVKNLGSDMTDYISGDGLVAAIVDEPVSDLIEKRLRCAHEASRMIIDSYDAVMARTWMFGCNQHLGGAAPAFVIRRAITNFEDVISAAKAFVYNA